MSTITKPRPRAGTGRGPAMPSAQRAEQAKTIITSTKRKVTKVMADAAINRSTRTQRAQRLKAEAFDQLTELGW